MATASNTARQFVLTSAELKLNYPYISLTMVRAASDTIRALLYCQSVVITELLYQTCNSITVWRYLCLTTSVESMFKSLQFEF